MELIFYATAPGGPEKDLKRAIRARISEEVTMKTYRSLEALAVRLRRPGDETMIAVLLASSRKELRQLVSIEDLLDRAAILLILPDRQEESIRTGHRLRPRFLGYVDGGTEEVSAVLEKMVRAAGTDKALCRDDHGAAPGPVHPPWSAGSNLTSQLPNIDRERQLRGKGTGT